MNGTDFTNPKVQSWTTLKRLTADDIARGKRGFAHGKQTPNQMEADLAKVNVKELSNRQKAKRHARALDRVNCPLFHHRCLI